MQSSPPSPYHPDDHPFLSESKGKAGVHPALQMTASKGDKLLSGADLPSLWPTPPQRHITVSGEDWRLRPDQPDYEPPCSAHP